MSTSKKIFLAVFALFILGINVALYSWAQSLKAEEVTYLKDAVVWKLSFDRQDRLWATVSRKLYESCSLDELRVYENGVITHVYTDIEDSCIFRGEEDLIVDSTGRIWNWAKFQKFVVIIDGEDWLKVPLDFMNDEPYIRTIAVDSNGKLWIGTANDGLYIVDGGLGVGRWSREPFGWGHAGQTPGFQTL